MYKVSSPILFLIFNRPDVTQKVFEKIRSARPQKLYVAADGPRHNKTGEFELCEATRQKIHVDWPCEVHTLYRDENLGCKMAVSGAIRWFFSNVEEGIILEDDCLPGDDFFRYCDTLLERYRHDTRIVHISGARMSLDKRFGETSYYFSKYTFIWGWASWRRVWEHYDEDLRLLDEFIKEDIFKYVYQNKTVTDRITRTLIDIKEDRLNTWDFQYAFMNFWNNGLSISPNVNLISNIGFDAQATHTTDSGNKFANIATEPLGEIVHPKFFLPIIDADYHILKLEGTSTVRRLKRKISKILQGK